MLRSATKQTSRVLRRSRTIPRVAQSVRHHCTGDTEGDLGVLSSLVVVGSVVGIGGTIAYFAEDQIDAAIRLFSSKEASYRSRNTDTMRAKWYSIAPSRKGVLNKTYNNNHYLDLHKLFGIANKSNIDQITPAPKSVADVIQFFLWWKFYDDDKIIDSACLKERLGPRFFLFHEILNEIRDEEAKSWHQADSDNLNEVIGFLDKMSKMEMNR